MSRKLFVGGISWNTTEGSLQSAFSAFGEVVSAKIIMDRETGKSRGFGFVEFKDPDSAHSAIENLDGTELDGRTIKVDVATERARPSRPQGRDGNRKGGRERHNR